MTIRLSSCLLLFYLSILHFVHGDQCPPYESQLDKANIRFVYNKTEPATKDGFSYTADQGPTELIVNMTVNACYNCLDHDLVTLTPTQNLTNVSYFLFSTSYDGKFFVYNQTVAFNTTTNTNTTINKLLYTQDYSLREHGRYTFFITDTFDDKTLAWSGLKFEMRTEEDGDNIFIPIYIAFAVFMGLTLLYNLGYFFVYGKGRLWIRCVFKKPQPSTAEEKSIDTSLILFAAATDAPDQATIKSPLNRNNDNQKEEKRKETKERLKSLDTFRGISLCIMIFVNCDGGGYEFLQHAPWNGLQLADLVFPWFIWMMGVSMAISFESQQKRGATKKQMLQKVLERTAKLVVLSLMTSNGNNPFNQLRIPGVLMRFAVSYFAVSLIIIYVPKIERPQQDLQVREASNNHRFEDLIRHAYELIPIFILLVLWLSLTFGLHVPGCPTGYLGPGGLLGDYGLYPNCTGGAAGYIDRQLFGVNHLYQWPTSRPIYMTGPFDPEGALGNLTSIIMVYTGLMAGRVVLYHKTHKARLTRWLIGAFILGCLSLLLCHGKQNGGWIPINKNLWSLSFIITLSSFALLVLPLLYVLIDIWKVWGGGPFMAMGMNSIAIFCGSGFLGGRFPFAMTPSTIDGCPNPTKDTHGWLLFQNLTTISLWLIIANWMHYEKFYLNV